MTDPQHPTERTSSLTGTQFPLLIGNRPFIDFANSHYVPEGAIDPLDDWRGYLNLLTRSRVMKPVETSPFLAVEHEEKNAILSQARHLRTTLGHMNAEITNALGVPDSTLLLLNTLMAHQDGGFRLQAKESGFDLVFTPQRCTPAQTLGAVARSTADFLCKDSFRRLRKCANPGCTLYFYDTSKNGRRRWCRMKVCGNRTKASGFYRRSKQPD